MADEISVSASLSVNKNGALVTASSSIAIDMAGTEMISSVQQFSTADTQAISLGGCDSVGAILIKNMEAEGGNNLTVSLNATHTQVISVIPPQCAILLHGVSTTIYAKSSASTVEAFVACGEA